jgi:adenylyltransferase/sulfurtransferase
VARFWHFIHINSATGARIMHQEKFRRMGVKEAKKKLDSGWKPYVLDCRKPEEADIVKFDFTDRLQPHDKLEEIISELPDDREILIHCRSGGRSAKACEYLAEKGFKDCINLEGGILDWAKEIDPSMPTY